VTSTVFEHSAGGVLWRPTADGKLAVCLIATRGNTRWQLPKGHVGEGETEAAAARREVREETGCEGTVEEDLGEILFWFFVGAGAGRKRIKKSVRFFVVRYERGETSDHDGEVDAAAFFDADEAIRLLTFDSERQILVRAVALLRARSGAASPADGAA
jgi:8-oxo-dGTP pyrophosphatase MutT (NUDIX family)